MSIAIDILRKRRGFEREVERAAAKPPKRGPRRKCVACGKPISGPPLDHVPFHSQACARVLLQRILISVPGVIELLPREWRADLQ